MSQTIPFNCDNRYFLARILDNVGIHDNRTKNLINLANTCWGFVNATILALTVSRLKRRTMYLVRTTTTNRLASLMYTNAMLQTCTISLLVVFTGWTVASARYSIDGDQGSSKAVIAYVLLRILYSFTAIFTLNLPRFIFLYSPCYNMAYNALTYSESIQSTSQVRFNI
jgi:hypothetical protein